MTAPARGRVRAVLFDAGNTLLRMNYAAIAGHLVSRGHAIPVEAIEESELRARVRLDAGLARGISTEGRSSQDSYLVYLLEGIGISDREEIEAAAEFRRRYNAPAGLYNVADPEALPAIRRLKSAGLVTGVEKPDPQIFHLGLERAGVAAHEAVYIGDLYSIDVLGSRAAGIGAILLDPRGFWGPRDCDTARTLVGAIGLVLDPTRAPTG